MDHKPRGPPGAGPSGLPLPPNHHTSPVRSAASSNAQPAALTYSCLRTAVSAVQPAPMAPTITAARVSRCAVLPTIVPDTRSKPAAIAMPIKPKGTSNRRHDLRPLLSCLSSNSATRPTADSANTVQGQGIGVNSTDNALEPEVAAV